ncbi:hypothetical protein KI387_026704, partial [Taxus chinensis]
VRNTLTKVSVEVARWNVDKATTIRALLDDKKYKDTEIKRLTEEKEKVEAEVKNILRMAKQIGDEIIEKRPHFQEKVVTQYKSALHY